MNRLVFALGVAFLSASASAQDEDANYDLHELALWGLDPTLAQANELAHYPSAMPGVVDTDRSRANEARKLTPMSIITLHGEPVADLEVDLRVQSGRFVGHWPPAEAKSGRLRWLDMASAAEAGSQALFAAVDDKHWFVQARQLDALFVQDKSRAERFLTYDCEMKYELPLQLTGGPDKYQITNSGKHALLDLFVIVPVDDGMRVGHVESLPPSKAKTQAGGVVSATNDKKPEKKPDGQKVDGQADSQTADSQTRGQAETGAKPADAPAAERAPAQPGAADAPAGVRGAAAPAPAMLPAGSLEPTELAMSPPVKRDGDEIKAVGETLASSLLKLGFTQREVDLLLARAGNTWLEAKQMVVLLRLPVEAIEERLPLTAYPAPRKTLRAALVVVGNIDPKIKDEVQQLIARLGSAEYTERESAEKRLTELGRLAVPALKLALKSADLEVVFRAERILLAQNEKLEGT